MANTAVEKYSATMGNDDTKSNLKNKYFNTWMYVFNTFITLLCATFIIRDCFRENELEKLKTKLTILANDITLLKSNIVIQNDNGETMDYNFFKSNDLTDIKDRNEVDVHLLERRKRDVDSDREKRSGKTRSNKRNVNRRKHQRRNKNKGKKNKSKKGKNKRNKGKRTEEVELTEEEVIKKNKNGSEIIDVKRVDEKITKRRGKKQKSSRPKPQVMNLHIDPKRSEPKSPDLKTGVEGSVIEYWTLSDSDFNYKQTFGKYNHNGTVTIKHSGLYFIYSQMTYYDRSGRWSHLVDVSNKPIAKCLASEWGIGTDDETGLYYNTVHQCYTATTASITRGDIVSIKSMYSDRVIHADAEMSFWGIVKLY